MNINEGWINSVGEPCLRQGRRGHEIATNAITDLLDLHKASTQFCKEVNKANYHSAITLCTCGCQTIHKEKFKNAVNYATTAL